MKKLPNSAGAKRQIALQKIRCYQEKAIKRRSVHAAPQSQKKITLSAKQPKKAKRTTKKTGMISLRVERMTARLLRSMKECPGASFETHADACKIGLSTFYRWMEDGEKDPNSIYGRFRQTMIQAMAEGEKTLHNMAAKSTPIHVLTRRFPNHYPSERMRLDMTSDSMPIMQQSGNFTVLLELHPAAGVSQQQPETAFEVQEATGQRWKWTPEEDRRRRPGGNGELPR